MSYSVGDYGRFTQIAESTANTQTADYTLALTDGAVNTVVEMNKGSAVNLTVPPNSSVAFDIGTTILIWQEGAGQVTVVAGAGVTIHSASSHVNLTGQYSWAVLRKQATNTWVLWGDLSA